MILPFLAGVYVGIGTACSIWCYLDDTFEGTALEAETRFEKASGALLFGVTWLPVMLAVVAEEEL